MVSRSSGFGFVGSVITTVVYALTFLYYFRYEGDIMASGITLYSGLNVNIIIILFVVFLPTILWGYTSNDKSASLYSSYMDSIHGGFSL